MAESRRNDGPNRYGPTAAVRRQLNREAVSATVSYRRVVDGTYAVTVGHGSNVPERVADADAQLPPGEWLRLCVSTPLTIYADVYGRVPRDATTQGGGAMIPYPRFELHTVHVERAG